MSVLKLYNKDAYEDNLLVMHASKSGCCGNEAEFCKYYVEEAITNVTDITINIDGEPVVVVFEEAANTPREIRKAIAMALKKHGYDPYYEDAWKGIKVTDTEICLIGEMDVESINVDGTQVEFEKACETGRICKFRGLAEYEVDLGLLSYNGAVGTQIGTTDGFVAGDTAAVVSNLEAALNAQSVPFTKVEVEEQTAHETYVYTIHLFGDLSLTINGESLSPCGCYPDFIKDTLQIQSGKAKESK